MTRHAALFASGCLVAWLALPLPAPGAEDPPAAAPESYKKVKFVGAPFVYYSPESKLAFGGGGIMNFRTGKRKAEIQPSSIWAYASYNMAHQFRVYVKPEIYLDHNNLVAHGTFIYARTPQYFYGVGNDTLASDKESYTPRTLLVRFGLKKRVYKRVFAGLQFDYQKVQMEKVEPGGILDTEDLVGSEGGNVSGLGLTVDWDTRDSVLFPRRGSFVQVDVDGYSAITEDYAGFFSFRIDARRYVAVGRGVMAIETYFHTNSGDVPFDRLALLGGESLLRGYYKGRFRDKGLLLLQAEYRVFVTKRIGVAGFAGVADVFPGIGEFRVEKLKYALGSGIRYLVNKRDNTTVRVDMAWGQASFGFYVTAREAF